MFKGFVGVKEQGMIKGFKHPHASYKTLGLLLLHILEHEKPQKVTKIFHDSIARNGNHEDFLWDGFNCRFGYVYDPTKDVLQVYRGGFFRPKHAGSDLISYNVKLHTHRVAEIKREQVKRARALFLNYGPIYEQLNKHPYFEREYLSL
jgi:hypothetical protein